MIAQQLIDEGMRYICMIAAVPMKGKLTDFSVAHMLLSLNSISGGEHQDHSVKSTSLSWRKIQRM